jgi:hypothetical protein
MAVALCRLGLSCLAEHGSRPWRYNDSCLGMTIGGASSLSDLSTKQEQNKYLFHDLNLNGNMTIISCPDATYSSANLLSPTGC